MSEPVRYDHFKDMCDNLNGKLPTPVDFGELLTLHEQVRQAYEDLQPTPLNCMLANSVLSVSTVFGKAHATLPAVLKCVFETESNLAIASALRGGVGILTSG